MTLAMTTSRPRTLYKQPDRLPLDQAVYSAGRKPGFFMGRKVRTGSQGVQADFDIT